jgi:hypothetical protein
MIKKFLLSIAVLFSTFLCAQDYTLIMSNPTIDIATMKYTFTISITSTGKDFQLNSSNIRFNFNNAGLSTAKAPVFNLTLKNGSDHPTSGLLSSGTIKYANVAWANKTASGPVISATPTEIGTVTMDILDPNQLAGLQFRLFDETNKNIGLEKNAAITSTKIFKMDLQKLGADLSSTINLLNAPLNHDKLKNLNDNGNRISVYPNPANALITLLIPKDLQLGNYTVATLQDMSGKVIATRVINEKENNVELDVQNFASGKYIMNITSNNGLNTVEKLVVQH